MDRKDFDPDGVGVDNGNYFGFPFTEEDARLVLLSVPWDVTASYGGGAAFGPDAIIEASTQLDFYDPMSPGAWKKGVATVPIDYSVQDRSARLRPDAKKIMESLQEGGIAFEDYLMPRRLERINTASAELNRTVYEAAAERLDAGHVVGSWEETTVRRWGSSGRLPNGNRAWVCSIWMRTATCAGHTRGSIIRMLPSCIMSCKRRPEWRKSCR